MTTDRTFRPWKLTLPVDSSGGATGRAREIRQPALATYQSQFLTRDPDGWITLIAPVEGARTSSSTRYTRTEFREMVADGSTEIGWTPESDGSRQEQTCAVVELPILTAGTRLAVVVGQIHGPDDEPCRLYYVYDRAQGVGRLTFADDQPISGDETWFSLLDADGKEAAIPLGAPFTYIIEMDAVMIRVTAWHNDRKYQALSPLSAFWRGKKCYNKAGVYNAVGGKDSGATNRGTGQAVVRFRGINAPIHGGYRITAESDRPMVALPDVPPPVDPVPDPTPTPPTDGYAVLLERLDQMEAQMLERLDQLLTRRLVLREEER